MSEGDEFTVRPVESDDAERIREIVDSSMTTSYALSPQDIETIVEAEFDDESQRERYDDSDTVALVADRDDVQVGFVEASAEEGAVRRLHVDPEHRGIGIGTTLFERALSELEGEGVEDPRAITMAANQSSGTFFETFDFEKVDERDTDVGGRETVEYVFAEGGDGDGGGSVADAGGDGDSEETAGVESAAGGLEETVESEEDVPASREDPDRFPETAAAEDGDEVYLGDETHPGTEGTFVPTYADEDRTEEYGFYCGNCGSTNVQVTTMERLRCENCGNTRKPGEDYDATYL